MAENLCQLMKKGGGGLEKTVLWTRPSSQTSFGEVTITLSDDVNNYDYIGIKFDGRHIGTIEYDEYEIIMPIATYNDSYRDGSTSGSLFLDLSYFYGSTFWYREVQKLTDTTLKVSARLPGSQTDLACAPSEIYGLK